jgi:hypothetical protein
MEAMQATILQLQEKVQKESGNCEDMENKHEPSLKIND